MHHYDSVHEKNRHSAHRMLPIRLVVGQNTNFLCPLYSATLPETAALIGGFSGLERGSVPRRGYTYSPGVSTP